MHVSCDDDGIINEFERTSILEVIPGAKYKKLRNRKQLSSDNPVAYEKLDFYNQKVVDHLRVSKSRRTSRKIMALVCDKFNLEFGYHF